MEKTIPDDIIYSRLKYILNYMKDNNIGLNEPIKVIGKNYYNFYPSILYTFIYCNLDIEYSKEIIRRGANVNIVNKSLYKKTIFELLIEHNKLKLLYFCIPYFELKNNYNIMKCVYDNIKDSTKIDRKAKLLNRLSSMFHKGKWERVKKHLEKHNIKIKINTKSILYQILQKGYVSD